METIEVSSAPEAEKEPVFDVLIVLGSGIEDKPGRLEPGSPDGKMRVIAAAEAYRLGLTRFLIFSGGRTKGKGYPSEAEVMVDFMNRKYRKEGGKFSRIPKEAVVLEKHSIDTTTNLRNSLKIAQEKGTQKIGVLTNEYHLPRVVEVAGKFGFGPEPISTETKLVERDRRFEPIVTKFTSSLEMKQKEKREKYLRSISQKPGGLFFLTLLAKIQRR